MEKLKQSTNYEHEHAQKLGICLPPSVIQRIDSDRGDINRSRYILRLLELGFGLKEDLK